MAIDDRIPLLADLEPATRAFIQELAECHHFTHQELRQLCETARDLQMWREEALEGWWNRQVTPDPMSREQKKRILTRLRAHRDTLAAAEKRYPVRPLAGPPRGARRVTSKDSDATILGRCPVYSDKTICCGLYTIDAVRGCAFSCSYCTIQTFYPDTAEVDANLSSKLGNLQLEPGRFYHLGTGQSSDALVWGNRSGLIDTLCHFAESHPDVLLELKSKSDNVRPLLQRQVPQNVVCSWSLNPQSIIANEEHGAASLERRLAAARSLADQKRPVAFHLHPMVHYKGWKSDYSTVIERLLELFLPQEIAFLSLGSMTFIKPVLRQIRRRGGETKVLQMPMSPDPHGKLTYPIETKVALYRHAYQMLAPWQNQVFMYLCMEPEEVWQRSFGWCFESSQAFEQAFAAHWKKRQSYQTISNDLRSKELFVR